MGQNNHRTPAQSRLQYNQQQYPQRQQQQHWGQPPPNRHPQHDPRQGNPQWNIGASEFVPKSNLSVSAEGFVPRTVPRNTSQWAYQQQPQQQQQQPQNQQSQQQQQQQPQQTPNYSSNSYGYQPHMDYPGSNYGNTSDNNQQF